MSEIVQISDILFVISSFLFTFASTINSLYYTSTNTKQ